MSLIYTPLNGLFSLPEINPDKIPLYQKYKCIILYSPVYYMNTVLR